MGNRCAEVVPPGVGSPAARGEGGESDGTASDSDEDKEDQDHVFAFAGELKEEELAELDEQFRTVLDDRAWWARAFQEAKNLHENGEPDLDFAPPQQLSWGRQTMPRMPAGASVTAAREVPERVSGLWQAAGYDVIGRDRVAAVVLAGRAGEGRLGRGAVLGMADVGLLSGKPPFQVLCERLLRLQGLVDGAKRALKELLEADDSIPKVEKKRIIKLHGHEKISSLEKPCRIPLFIMTDMASFQDVRRFFEMHENFGLLKSQVVVFPQNDTPVFDSRGKVRLAAKNRLMTHPGGGGDLFRAMEDQGILADLKAHDIEFVWVGSIDNLLTKIADPIFLGFCVTTRLEMGLKVVERLDCDEELGLLVQCSAGAAGRGRAPEGGLAKARFIRYADLPWGIKNGRAGTGSTGLVYRHANACQFVFTTSTLNNLCQRNDIRHHWVPISRPYVDWRHGGLRRSPAPSQRGSVRLQRCLADAVEAVPSAGGYLVQRHSEFAPMKGLQGRSSISKAVCTLSRAHQRWILDAAGPGFPGFWGDTLADESQERLCEVSPLVSYDGEGLGGAFVPGSKLELPLHLEARNEALSSTSPRQEAVDLEAISLPQRAHSLKFTDVESPVFALETRLQQEARQRASGAAVGEGRPLTGGVFAEGESGERLPATPKRKSEGLAKVEAKQSKSRHQQKDQQAALARWQASKAFQDALNQVTRLPQLDRLDEQRLKAHRTKVSSMGDSVSEQAGSRQASKTRAAEARRASVASAATSRGSE